MISYENVLKMVKLLEDNQELANHCRTCIGPYPNDGNLEFMQDVILSRMHDIENNMAAIRELYRTAVEE